MYIGQIKFGEVVHHTNDSYGRVVGLLADEEKGKILIKVAAAKETAIWDPESCSSLTAKEKGEADTLFHTLEMDRLERDV